MAKYEIEIALESEGEMLKNTTTAIITNNTIKYSDNGVLTVIKYNNNEVVMSRENDEYKIILNFKEKSDTNGTYIFKENNINYTLNIYTKDLKYSDNDIKIEYVLNEDDKVFLLHIKE